MRESDWRIEWDVTGESPLRLLDYGDLLTGEIELPVSQGTDAGRFDRATATVPAARGNRRRTLGFERVVDHATREAAFQAVHSALAACPWGSKAYLSITPRDGTARTYLASLTRSAHEPLDLARSAHFYEFRVTPADLPE